MSRIFNGIVPIKDVDKTQAKIQLAEKLLNAKISLKTILSIEEDHPDWVKPRLLTFKHVTVDSVTGCETKNNATVRILWIDGDFGKILWNELMSAAPETSLSLFKEDIQQCVDHHLNFIQGAAGGNGYCYRYPVIDKVKQEKLASIPEEQTARVQPSP